jgi:beta-glucosidase
MSEAASANGHLFPQDFLWGVSTSAYQVEDGEPENQWVEWERQARIKSGDRRGLACQWWSNPEGDFDLARGLGLNALRLSVEWSRIEPRPGEWQPAAIARYREILKALHQRGLRPFVTLHHFTNPSWFEDREGFLSPESPSLFARFAARVVAELGDLCRHWITINEPNVYSSMGYQLGEFPPGKRGHFRAAARTLANMARAHARACDAIHGIDPEAKVGWAQNYLVFAPANPNSRFDRLACRILDGLFNESFFRIVETGDIGFPLRHLTGDLSEVRNTGDFVGLNVYNRTHVAFDLRWPQTFFSRLFIPHDAPQGDPGTEWPYGEAYPRGIRLAVERASRLRQPLYILENGIPDAQDRLRPAFLVAAISEVQELLRRGFDIGGYFHWTLIDNFEWSEGWKLRFGLFALDPETQSRSMRPSAEVYSAIVRNNGIPHPLRRRLSWPRLRDFVD